MTRDDILALFARREKAWADRDAGALASSHTEHCTVHSPMFATVRGRKDILTSYRSLFRIFPDWSFVGETLVIDGDRVAQPFMAQATHAGEFMGLAGTGRRFAIQGVLLMKIEDGLIAEERRVYDFSALLIQIGILRVKSGQM